MGKPFPAVWDVEWSNAKIIKIQYMVAFIGHQLANKNITTNQKQVAAMELRMEERFDKRDVWGERDAIILGAL